LQKRQFRSSRLNWIAVSGKWLYLAQNLDPRPAKEFANEVEKTGW
jgi:hypothetical protein